MSSQATSLFHSRERQPAADAASEPRFQAPADAAASAPRQGAGFGQPILEGRGAANIGLEVRNDLAAAALEWKIFERFADHTPFQSFDWLDAWQRHIGARKGSEPVIVSGRDEKGILFILPLAIEKHGKLRRLTFLGVELGDYNAPLLSLRFVQHPAAQQFAAVWKSITALLRSDEHFRFDIVDLPKMPETVGAQKNPLLQLKVFPNRSGAYVATLGDNWDSYYAARRSSSTRKTNRRKQKSLEKHGKLSFVEVAPEDAAPTMAALIEQKSATFARMGVENLFERPGYPEFFTALASNPQMRDFIHFSRFDVGDMVGATSIGLQLRGRYYLILSSYNNGEISRWGPGRAHLHELLRNTIERGYRYFDFTIGDEAYKLDWSDSKLVLYDHLAAFTLRGWLVKNWVVSLRRVTRFIKQTPFLWRITVKVRAWLGGRQPPMPAAAED